MSYLLLVFLYTYVALKPVSPDINYDEWALAVWFGTMIFDEFRQIFQEGFYYQSFKEWAHMWNIMDVCMYFVFVIAFTTRLIGSGLLENCRMDYEDAVLRGKCDYFVDDNLLKVAKALYGFNLIQVWIRSMQFLKIFQGIGVKIEIFKNLFSELFEFMILLFVCVISYGIYVQTVYSTTLWTEGDGTSSLWNVFMRIIYRPYFQVYGELMLEDLAEESSCFGKTLPFTSCSNWTEYSIPLITMLYLMVTSIMLMNMLIASFTDTYNKNIDIAVKLHRIGMYTILDDYEDRPLWPMPLGFLSSVWWLLRLAWDARKWESNRTDIYNGRDTRKHISRGPKRMAIEEQIRVEKFQDIHADAFIEENRVTREHSMQTQVDNMERKINKALDELALSRGKSSAFDRNVSYLGRPAICCSLCSFNLLPIHYVTATLTRPCRRRQRDLRAGDEQIHV